MPHAGGRRGAGGSGAEFKVVIQVGMQRRSYDLYLAARKIVASGTLGHVRMVRSWWLNNSLERTPATKLDGKLDWEQWQGPARNTAPSTRTGFATGVSIPSTRVELWQIRERMCSTAFTC